MGVRTVVVQPLARAALLILWSLVAWGALLFLLTLVDAVSEGPGPALARLLPARGASVWAWLNALSIGLAVAVGLVGAGLAWTRRTSAPDSRRPRRRSGLRMASLEEPLRTRSAGAETADSSGRAPRASRGMTA